MARGWRGEERLMWKLVGKGSRRGASLPSRAGDAMRKPRTWAIEGALLLNGPHARRAALRGTVCAGTSSLIHYPSDILSGGALAFAVAGAAWRCGRPPPPRRLFSHELS